MKKIYITIVCLLPLLAMAQPTITQSDLPGPGTGWLSIKNSFSGAILPGGNNVTWDYSALTGTNDTTAFYSTAGSPLVATFPAATCAVVDHSNSKWQYYTVNSTGFYLNGGSNSPVLVFNPAWLYVPVPFTYNDTKQNEARFVYDTAFGGHNYREIYHISSHFVADGWGTLTIPSGTYSNVLREKVTDLQYDSILVDAGGGNYVFAQYAGAPSGQVTYRWIRHDPTTPVLLEIDADSLGTTAKKSSYLLSAFTVGVNDLKGTDNSLNVYPNPASTNVRFDLQESKNQTAVLKVYNSLGEEITSREVKGISYFELVVDKFASGIYYYSLISDSNKRSGKFSVAH